MTTSPPPSSNGELKPDSIGWLFIEKYYQVYTKDLANIYRLYDTGASITHDKFPGEDKVVFQARGHDAIKTHFGKVDQRKNRIVITGADFQFSVDKSILIVVFGEWAKADSQYWQFVQSFVLTPSKEKVYDVANDILKFVDFNGEAAKVEETVSTATTATTAEAKAEVVEPVEKAEKEVKEEPKEEKKEPKEEKEEKKEPKEEKKEVKKEEPKEDKKEVKKEVKEEKKEDKPKEKVEKAEAKVEARDKGKKSQSPQPKEHKKHDNAPLSWADLAAKEPPKSQKTAVASPSVAKVAPVPAVVKKPTPPANGNKYKKDDWYPIYIRNVDVDTELLKETLVKQFGPVKFFKRNLKVVLCDFETKEDQEAAIKAKSIKIGDNVISLEPREARSEKFKGEFKKKVNKKKGPKN